MKPIRSFIYKKCHRSGKVTWVVRWQDTNTGRWCNSAAGRTKTEATILESRIREELLKGEDPRSKSSKQEELRISELIDLFYKSPRFLSASPQWQVNLRGQFENEIRPSFGKTHFSSLKKDRILKYLMDLKGQELSNRTVLCYFRKLSLLGQLYIDLYPGKINPIDLVKDLNRYFPKQAPTREISFLTPLELDRLFVELKKSRLPFLFPFIKFLAHSGLRRTEALELTWTAIDFESGFIHIRKSKNGLERRVPLEEGSIQALSQLPRTGSFIFETDDGKRCRSDSFLKPLQRAAKRAGIAKRIDLHSMRHSWASNKIRAGWGLRKVSQILGHSDITITSETYTHLLDGDLKVQDQFLFDNSRGSTNIRDGEQEKTVTMIVNQLIHQLRSTPVEALHQPLLAQNVLAEIQKVINTGKERTPAIQSEPSRQSSKTPVLVPHMFRRGRKKACDPISVAEADSSSSIISSGYVVKKWCTHPGSNGEPSVPKTDALSS